MNIFDGIEHVLAEGTSNRQYFEEGNYLVQINSVFLHEKRLGGGKLFVVETTVLESSHPNISAGEQRNWLQSLSNPYALPRIKAFIGAAMGMNAKEINFKITSQVCNNAVGLNNPLKGRKISLSCTPKTTQNGKIFTKHNWSKHDA